eukprot:TRINITY_DN9876_c0_g1_i5.p1 TRINITY_DN9876_c0_g1~~TRINITY_DN9876_c0_g1_i5.p1  ORF type:complete len:596 (+),score=109.71 TRINITY_DN9876_c0_g1_i5:103-1890(+)
MCIRDSDIPLDLADLIRGCLRYTPEKRIAPEAVLISPFIFGELFLDTDIVSYLNTIIDRYNTVKVERRLTVAPYNFIEIFETTPKYTFAFCQDHEKNKYLVKTVDISSFDLKSINEIAAELELLAQVKSTAFYLAIEDCFICDNYLYIVMEWGELTTLKSFLKKQCEKESKLSALNVNMVAWQLACALREMHTRGAMHKSLCTRYVAVDTNPVTGLIANAKLFNFWGCRQELGDCSWREKNVPPEMEHTLKGDVWNYGKLLLKLAFGKSLCKINDQLSVVKGSYLLPYAADNLSELHKLIAKCLNVDPEKRPGLEEITSDLYFSTMPHVTKLSISPYTTNEPIKYDKPTQKLKCKLEPNKTFELHVFIEPTLTKEDRKKIMLMYRICPSPYTTILHEYFWVGRFLYLVYDCIEGISLESYIAINYAKITTREVVKLAFDSAKALRHLHSKNIVYRNLCPASITVIDVDGRVKLTDYSAARFLFSEEVSQSKIIDQVTAIYFAPELFSAGVTYKADIWSYGLLLYQLLFGFHPINYIVDGKQKNNYGDMFRKGIFNHPEKDCDQSLIRIMNQCLQIEPADRPTADEILSNPIFKSY